jgi:hypothetical protein
MAKILCIFLGLNPVCMYKLRHVWTFFLLGYIIDIQYTHALCKSLIGEINYFIL